jgi:hypothetical protein
MLNGGRGAGDANELFTFLYFHFCYAVIFYQLNERLDFT